ncbi:MAG: sodium/proline symporter [Oceanococcus sp.]
MVASFIIFLFAIVAIGISSARRAKPGKRDYYLASSDVPPWLVGLSAVATNNSGYMFIGVIGYTWTTGLASIWLMLGWITGDLIASFLVHRRLREAVQRSGEVSFAGAISHWDGQAWVSWQRLSGLIAISFLLAYTGAQLLAGSKALHVLFDWPLWAGAIIGAVMVAAYCVAGGIRASIWTDAAQSMVMIVSMSVLLVVAVQGLGGYSAAVDQMSAIEGYMDWVPSDLAVPGVAGGILFALSWLFAGLSVIGQPHVMVRFMTLQSAEQMPRMRMWYYLWFSLFYAMATGVGLLSRVYFNDGASFDAELALPLMAQSLLPPVMVGLILAGIFAATLSTADSLILAGSATLTHDLLPQRMETSALLKLSTLGLTLLALVWALLSQDSVFSLVLLAWSGLACTFGPLLLVLSFGARLSQRVALAMSVTGLAVALIWRQLGWHAAVYEGMPGILAGLAVFAVSYYFNKRQVRHA